MMELLRDMASDWFGRTMLGLLVLAFGIVAWAFWADAHDGRRCVETRFSHFQTSIIGKSIMQQPVYKCVRWVEDPDS
jgi:hypothetical protein